MFSRKKEPSLLERETTRALDELNRHDVGSKEYVTILDSVVKLQRVGETQKPSSVNKNTMATIGANLLGILMVIKHEHVNVIMSRAMQMVWKLK